MESGFRPLLRRSVILLAIPLLLASPMIGGGLAQPIPPTQSPSIHPASTPGRPRATSQGYSYPTHLVPNSSKPVNSTLGYFDGEWYNSTLHITPGKPLNASERHAFVARTMARDELILHRNYKRYVPVRFVSRQAYKHDRGLNSSNSSTSSSKGTTNATPPTNSTYSQWNNVIWRATFIVGERQNVQTVMNRFYGGHVGGYYAPHSQNITLISPNGTVAGLAPSTLAHELTHAMQNQYYNTSQEKYQGRTQDSQLAAEGLLEGQANYVKAVYHHECQTGQWSCLSQQATSTSSQSSSSSSASASNQGSQQSANQPTQTNYGVEWVLYFPYAMGPHYISTLVHQHGWQAVYQRFQNPPKTSATIIADHPVPPATINVSLHAGSHWQRYQGVGVNGTDRPGEATIYSMFWWQTYHHHARLIPPRSIINKHGGPFDHYDYSSPPSAGWTGGKIVPFHSQANASRRGFVWVTTWRTRTNATQFRTAYKLVLKAHNATKTGPSTWTVPASDSYAGTYRLTTNGTTDTIVSAPSPQALTELSPSVTVHAAQTPMNTTPSTTTSQTATSTTTTPGSHTNASSPTTSSSSPGFGVAVALAAFALVAGFLALSRRS